MDFFTYSAKLLGRTSKDILFFPVWWYSYGLFYLFLKLKKFLANREKGLSLWVWIKNLFQPMYGQNDWQGAIISFFIRLFQIIFRSIIFIFWFILVVFVFLIWILLPILTVYEIIYQIF